MAINFNIQSTDSVYSYRNANDFQAHIRQICDSFEPKVDAKKAKDYSFYIAVDKLLQVDPELSILKSDKVKSLFVKFYDGCIGENLINNGMRLSYHHGLTYHNSFIDSAAAVYGEPISYNSFIKAILHKNLFDAISVPTTAEYYDQYLKFKEELSQFDTNIQLIKYLNGKDGRQKLLICNMIAINIANLETLLVALDSESEESIFEEDYPIKPGYLYDIIYTILTNSELAMLEVLVGRVWKKIQFLENNKALDKLSAIKDGKITKKRFINIFQDINK